VYIQSRLSIGASKTLIQSWLNMVLRIFQRSDLSLTSRIKRLQGTTTLLFMGDWGIMVQPQSEQSFNLGTM